MTIRSFEEEKQKTKKKIIIKTKQFLQSNGIQRKEKKDFSFLSKCWSNQIGKEKKPTQIKEEE